MTWEFGRFLYLSYLWDVAPRSYFESLQRRKISVREENVSSAIAVKIQETQRKFGNFCAEKREIIQCVLCEYRMRGDGNFKLFQSMGVFIVKVFPRRII